jgi:hypothetical protein
VSRGCTTEFSRQRQEFLSWQSFEPLLENILPPFAKYSQYEIVPHIF